MATLNKKDALLRLIRSSIELFLLRHDDLATHLVASSASKMAMDLCEKEDPILNFWKAHIQPEYHSLFFTKMRERYNFLKHADRDWDGSIDVEEIRFFNCFEIVSATIHCEMMYGKLNEWRSMLFFAYVASKHPDMLKIDKFSDAQRNVLRALETWRAGADIDQFFERQFKLMIDHQDELALALPNLGFGADPQH